MPRSLTPVRRSRHVVAWCLALLGVVTFAACGEGGATNPAAGVDASTPDDGGGGAGEGASPGDSSGIVQSGDAQVVVTDGGLTPGAKDRFLLLGTVVTPDVTMDGAVLVEKDKITCVDTAAVCGAKAGAAGATIIDTQGIITPGLIDTHNHILFDIFNDSDWMPAMLYQDHDQWTAEPKYHAMLDVKHCLSNDSQGKPTWCANTPYGTAAGSLRCEMDKWGELKGLVSGTTSIVGLPGTSAACFGSIARSVDVAQSGLPQDKVQTSALFPPSNPDGVCANFTSGATTAFLAHVGEGIDAKAKAEFATLGSSSTTANCLYAKQTSITHGVAFDATEFGTMAAAGMRLTWSPHSNVSLYGATANIPLALSSGVEIALAPDWSMGGSQNMLEELRFAQAWDKAHFGSKLSSKDLVRMATVTPAKLLGLDTQIGSLAVGLFADLAVYAGDRAAPYDAILAAKPTDVRLVMVGGVPTFGDAAFMAAGPTAPGCETLDLCGASKFVCAATPVASDKLDQTVVTIKAALEAALTAADAQTTADGWNFAPLAPLYDCKK